MKQLTFEKLRKKNKQRCQLYFHQIEKWNEAEWCCALAGEVGELCNFVKKRTRILKSDKFQSKITMDELGEAAKKEIGDIQAYLDLVASAMGFKLEDCVRDKFNEVSDRVGSKIKL